MFANNLEHSRPIFFSRERDVKISHSHFEEAWQEIRIVHGGAMRRVEIPARASMYPYALPLFGRKPRQRQIVQSDETVKQFTRGIEFHCQSSFREIDLHLLRALRETAANLRFVLAQQIIDKLLARVSRD